MLKLFVGFDPREAAVYHTFCQSVIEQTTIPVSFIPLHQKTLLFDGQQDGTNAFTYSRYLVPYLCDFKGWAMFCDGDMIVRSDLSELWGLRDSQYAVQVVKHNYKTTEAIKYIDTPMENANLDYPRKNWSSVMLWNCAHPSNQILCPDFVGEAGGATLHRFKFLEDREIGSLDKRWNHLVREQPYDAGAKLVHWTLGSPGFEYYSRDDYHNEWNYYLTNAVNMDGERPQRMMKRAQRRRVA
jgi:hypothetical protein